MSRNAHPPRIRLFRHDGLERLTLISPRSFALTWLAVLALVSYASWGTVTVMASMLLIALGLLIWTLFEYAMHRFLFHWKARSKLGHRFIFLTHGNHHAAPSDPQRNIMPPLVSMGITGSVWGLFVVLMGRPGSVLFLGFIIGYILYDSVHYACHQFPMRKGILGQLRRHHIRHHFGKQEGNYAITAIFWDRVFGTRVSERA